MQGIVELVLVLQFAYNLLDSLFWEGLEDPATEKSAAIAVMVNIVSPLY